MTPLTSLLRRLGRDRRGVAAVEFALISTFLFATLMVGLDFGFYIQQKLRLGSAVEQAAMLAYNQQVASDTSAISNYVRNFSGVKVAPTVAITCNGTTSCGDGKCSCITSTGTFALAAACNTSCSAYGSQAVSGNYLKIAATTPYSAVIVPDRYLGGKTISQYAVVRLQ
ncbi:pilus assembly protein [Sphingomonas sp. AP4-R1]|uniref:TadE/TadG family type IV pilus assembly protein n=1 Tax=Sphingomonas sp. AP4-R1 TaxID=2735134 RepID=UPI0014937E57|nr:TadE/TadG family type IV pilus assembly protein [Sphingomonas sp. AP4-R1]QJU59385.1 pilus assembly protein [Sphingomonas sp. AP4-R1]